MPENVPIILNINGINQTPEYFSGGICNLSYNGNALQWSVKIGANGVTILSGVLSSASLTKEYNLNYKKIQKNINSFNIEDDSGVITIKNNTGVDIAKLDIYTI